MSNLMPAEHTFLLYVLGNITADAVQGDDDAFEALADPVWVGVITSLDNGSLNYEAFIARIVRLRDDYRRRGRPKEGDYARILREMRQAAAVPESEGGTARRLYRRRGEMPRLLTERAS